MSISTLQNWVKHKYLFQIWVLVSSLTELNFVHVKIILGKGNLSYKISCEILKTEELKSRREQICLKFARKEFAKQESMFTKFTPKFASRSASNTLVQEVSCNTDRYFHSSVPYLSRLLNYHSKSSAHKSYSSWGTETKIAKFPFKMTYQIE